MDGVVYPEDDDQFEMPEFIVRAEELAAEAQLEIERLERIRILSMAPAMAPLTPTKRPRREENKSEQFERETDERMDVFGDAGVKITACSDKDLLH